MQDDAWRGCLAWVFVPSLLFFCGIMLPESPRWLVQNGHVQKALGIMSKIGGKDYSDTILKDVQKPDNRC
jgi:hypothetical protein